MVPYFTFSVVWFFHWAFIEARFHPLNDEPIFIGWLGTLDIKMLQFVNIFIAIDAPCAFSYNAVLWFLPCLFVASIIYEGSKRIGGNSEVKAWIWKVLASLACIVAFAFTVSHHIRLPWCGELALLSVPFLLIGEVGYPRLRAVMERSKALTILYGGVSLVLFILLYLWLEPKTDMKAHHIPALWLFYLMAVLGSVFVMAMCRLIEYREHGWMQTAVSKALSSCVFMNLLG